MKKGIRPPTKIRRLSKKEYLVLFGILILSQKTHFVKGFTKISYYPLCFLYNNKSPRIDLRGNFLLVSKNETLINRQPVILSEGMWYNIFKKKANDKITVIERGAGEQNSLGIGSPAFLIKLRQFILLFVKVELFFEERIAFVCCTGRFVQIEVVVCSVNNATRNVGAVVGYTLKVG